MIHHDWDKLLCGYFYTVCLEVLSAYFAGYGFLPQETKVGGVTFKKNDIFIEISYDPQTHPEYSLTVVIGVGTAAYDDWGKFTGVPFWAFVPEVSEGGYFLTWTFTNDGE